MDRTFARSFATVLAGPTLAMGVLASALVIDTPAAADTMGLSTSAAGTPSTPTHLVTLTI
ncbi:hypothetical protein MANY_42610 [Mycolicibacterium anyangense]|jgi:hypothetical protein|uniref:Uncharacterized protein n=1 Tax=Mycolicibacterium anyangense TaxID=1431246 RepID=A0A6N4WFP7_9MYCO|nr:hypothetical protein [Mycolicibacterium anyangense]BBZ78924.1 hypothetical protein MANY_42610 [Mycolicibacterium anyangense]